MSRFFLGFLLPGVLFLLASKVSQAQTLEPRFPGCEDKSSAMDKMDCAEMKMLQFIFSNLRYPDAAKAAGVSGSVKAKFTVTVKGEVKNPSILTGLGHGCDEEVLRILGMMPPWAPGEENGTPKDMEVVVSVKFQ